MGSASRCLIVGLFLAVVPAALVVAEIPRVEPLKLATGASIGTPGTRYVRSPRVSQPETLNATMATNRVVPATSQRQASGWVTILGNVENAGTYEMGSAGITLRTLWKRCGGPADPSGSRVHLVRGARPWRGAVSVETPLQDGDLVILQTTGETESGARVTLGLIGLSETPKAVRVPAEKATVEGILALARQSHLKPAQVTILVDGVRAVPLPKDARLPDCAVLVFNPSNVKQEAVPPFQTNIFPLEESGSIALTAKSEAIDQASEAANASSKQESVAAPASLTPLEIPSGNATATTPERANRTRLSPLPSVENVPPPPTSRPTRTADRSGMVPIGRPETPSHIVRFSPNEFLPPKPPMKVATTTGPRSGAIGMAPLPPETSVEPVGIPIEDSNSGTIGNEDEEGDNLWTIVVSAVLLGVGTFYAIRRFRDSPAVPKSRQTIDQLKDRLGRPSTFPEFEQEDENNDPHRFAVEDTVDLEPEAISENPVAAVPEVNDQNAQSKIGTSASAAGAMLSPAEALSQLVANRMPFREEAVELPRSLFVQGRSKAPSRRRIDTGTDTAGEPHFDRNEEPADRWWPSQTVARYGDREGWSHAASDEPARDLVLDSSEQSDYLGASRDLGTPFEQALAKLRQSR